MSFTDITIALRMKRIGSLCAGSVVLSPTVTVRFRVPDGLPDRSSRRGHGRGADVIGLAFGEILGVDAKWRRVFHVIDSDDKGVLVYGLRAGRLADTGEVNAAAIRAITDAEGEFIDSMQRWKRPRLPTNGLKRLRQAIVVAYTAAVGPRSKVPVDPWVPGENAYPVGADSSRSRPSRVRGGGHRD